MPASVRLPGPSLSYVHAGQGLESGPGAISIPKFSAPPLRAQRIIVCRPVATTADRHSNKGKYDAPPVVMCSIHADSRSSLAADVIVVTTPRKLQVSLDLAIYRFAKGVHSVFLFETIEN